MPPQTVVSPLKFVRFAERLTGPPRPPHYDWDWSSRCGHRCPSCFFVDLDDKNRDMAMEGVLRPFMAPEHRTYFDRERALRLIDEIVAEGGRAVTLVGGGEPTMHPAFVELANRLVISGLKVGLISHFGLKYPPEFFEAVARFTWVRVSVNAATADTYAVRQGTTPAEFQRVLHNIALLRAVRTGALPRIGYSFLVAPENVGEIHRAAVMAKGAGADYIQYKPLITEKREDLYRHLGPKITKGLKDARAVETPEFQVLDQFQARLEELGEHWDMDFRGQCHVPRMNPKVCASGIVQVCCEYAYSETGKLGDLYEDDLRTILDRIPAVAAQIDMAECPPCYDKRWNKIINEGRIAEVRPPPESPDQDFV